LDFESNSTVTIYINQITNIESLYTIEIFIFNFKFTYVLSNFIINSKEVFKVLSFLHSIGSINEDIEEHYGIQKHD
jgi:hypothetical protein